MKSMRAASKAAGGRMISFTPAAATLYPLKISYNSSTCYSSAATP